MERVEHPVEVDRQDIADGAVHQDLLDLGAHRRVPVVEGHPAAALGADGGVDDRLAVLCVGRHGFLGQDVVALLHGAADVLVVEAVHCGHDDQVRPGLREHLVELGCSEHPRLRAPRLRGEALPELQSPGLVSHRPTSSEPAPKVE